jgi:hypothetical protein
MPLQKISMIIFLALLALLLLAGLYPTPLSILLVAGASSALVLLQTYAVLRDDSGRVPKGKPYLNYYQRK